MRFDGDIIITDPCYIINKDNDDRFDENGHCKGPSWWDFISKTTTSEIDDGKGGTWTRYNMPKPEDYPDCREKTLEDCKDDLDKTIMTTEKLLGRIPKKFSPTLQAEWDAYHKAEAEYNSVYHDDWSRCGCGEDMSVLGLKTWITNDTGYGDWSCHTFNKDTEEPIGEFCADAGMVGVFLLDEVLKYNPHFDYHTERPWTTTLIKDFHGEVEIKTKTDGGTVYVEGKGNINFITGQTGL